MSRKFVRYYFCYESAGMTCNPFIIESSRESMWRMIKIHKNNKRTFNSMATNTYYNALVFKHIRVDADGSIVTYMAIYADKEVHNELIEQFNTITNSLEKIQ